MRQRKVTWNSHLFVPSTPVPSEIISSTCRQAVFGKPSSVIKALQPAQVSSQLWASLGAQTHTSTPFSTDRDGAEQGNGMSWLVPIENSLSSLAMPSPHCVLTGMEQRSFFSSHSTGNSYLQHFLPDIFLTAPGHSLQALTSTLRISQISPCHNLTSNGTHF